MLKGTLILEQARRLKLAREHAGYKSARMAAMRLGWRYEGYATHESGRRNISPKLASKYARAFGVHPDFIIFGTRPPEWYGTDAPPEKTALEEVVIPVRQMPLFDGKSADEIERMTGPEAVTRKNFGITDTGALPANCFAVLVSTDEISDIAPKGDYFIFEKDGEITAGSIVLLSVKRQVPPSIRKVKSIPGGRFRYVATNDDYEVLEDNEARVIGRAVLHIRML